MRVLFEDLFKEFDGFGKYQFLLLVLMLLRLLMPGRILLNFISARMDHWCRVPELEGMGEEVHKSIAIPFRDYTADTYDGCTMFDINYSNYTEEDFLNWTRLSNSTASRQCDRGWMYDISTFTETTVSAFDLVCGNESLVPLPGTLSFVGALAGTFIAGNLSDRFGRRRILIIFSLFDLAGGILAAVSPQYWLFCLGVFSQGVASNATYMASFVIMMEIGGQRYRHMIGMLASILYGCSYMIAALLGYYIKDFRVLQGVQISHVVFFITLFWRFVPDPPRWLIQQDRLEEAAELFRTMARVNGKQEPVNLNEMLQDIRETEKEMQLSTNRRTLLDLYSSRVLLIRSLALDLFWFSASMMSYALSLNAGSLSGNIYLNMTLLGVADIAAVLLGAYTMTVKFIGRRYTASGSLTIAGVSALTQVVLISIISGESTNALSFLGKGFVGMGFYTIYTLSAETFPTEVRHAGMGTASVCARIGGMIAPYLGPAMSQYWEPLPQMIFGSCAVIAGVGILVVPETLGLPLCQTIQEAEKRTVKRYKAELFETCQKRDNNEEIACDKVYTPTMESNTKF